MVGRQGAQLGCQLRASGWVEFIRVEPRGKTECGIHFTANGKIIRTAVRGERQLEQL